MRDAILFSLLLLVLGLLGITLFLGLQRLVELVWP